MVDFKQFCDIMLNNSIQLLILYIIGVFVLRTAEERLKSYEPLWENWTYTGEFLGDTKKF